MRLAILILGFLLLVGALLALVFRQPPPAAIETPVAEPQVEALEEIPTPKPAILATPVTIFSEPRFSETFDGEPAVPESWRSPNWDVTVHSRSLNHLYELAPMEAGHRADCSPPPAVHSVSAYDETVYLCSNHIMTAINDEGHGVIYLTPNQMVDFSEGEAVVQFDVSTARSSSRDWIDLWVTPYEENLQLPAKDWLPDLSGEPQRAVQIEMGFEGTRFQAFLIEDHEAVPLTSDETLNYADYFETSEQELQSFELRISQTHLRFGMPENDIWWLDTPIEALDWDTGIVQIGHHSYDPRKDCDTCSPNTWHWDNVTVDPAIPFTMVHADRRFVDPTSSDAVSLTAPAPDGAHLRFAGIGANLEVTFDGGRSWQPAEIQQQEKLEEDKFWSYWMPVPAGTQEIGFRGEAWWGGTWHVRDISVWSKEIVELPQPQGTATPLATVVPSKTAEITIDAVADGIPVDTRVLGTNLPAWVNPQRMGNDAFRRRTTAANFSTIRIPGGSWSNAYDWLACEQVENGGNDPACFWPWAAKPSDFIDFIRSSGAEAMYTVNMNGTAKEAAALVAFFNGTANDDGIIGIDVRGRDWGKVSDWAKLREAHGSPQPLAIRYWEIGNEIYGGKPGSGADCSEWGWEDVWTCDGTEYVTGIGSGVERREGYLEYREEMRAVDSSIQVGAVGVPVQSDWSNWGNEVIAAAGDVMDFYIIHFYGYFEKPDSYKEVLAQPQTVWVEMMNGIDQAFTEHAAGRQVPIAVTEYNLFSVQEQDVEDWMSRAVNGLYIADTIGQMLQQGFSLANQWDIAHGEGAQKPGYGLMQMSTFSRGAQYYIFPLWAQFGSQMLPVTSTLSAAEMLSVYAGRVNDKTVSLMLINKTSEPIAVNSRLEGVEAIAGATVDTLQANSLDATAVIYNGMSNPLSDLSDAPAQSLDPVTNPLTYTVPPYSVVLIQFRLP